MSLVKDGRGIEQQAAFQAMKTRPSLAHFYADDRAARFGGGKTRQDSCREKAMQQIGEMHKLLLADGWKLEFASDSGSLYFARGGDRVRVSDHEVPETADREHAREHGGFSWSRGRNIILPVDNMAAAVAALNDDIDESNDS